MIINDAKEYWTILRRFNLNRDNPAMRGAAVRDMKKIETANPAILRRIARFTPPPTGPKFA